MSSNANVTVQIFNANTLNISVSVNNGTQVQISGTGPSLNWASQQATNSPWRYTPGYPQPDVFGSGPNQVLLSVPGAISGQNLTITLPGHVPIFALQLYIFFATTQTITWVALNSGTVIAANTITVD